MVSPVDLAAPVPEIFDPPEKQRGPHMAKLTKRRRLFVLYLIHYKMQKGFGAQSARLAGFKGSDGTLKSVAYSLLRDENVRAAFREELAKLDDPMAWRAKFRLMEISEESENDNTVLAASKTILEMTGHMMQRVSHEHHHTHEIELWPTDKINSRIDELEKIEVAKRMAERERLRLNPPVEGTFTEVIPVDELSESLEPVTVELGDGADNDSGGAALCSTAR